MNNKIKRYFEQIELKVLQSPVVENYEIIRKDISDTDGKIRIRLSLTNKDLTDLFEYIAVQNNNIIIKKYHFHWQDKNKNLIKRWDNAPHHKELINFPHHIHYPDRVDSNSDIPDIIYVIGEIEVKLKK